MMDNPADIHLPEADAWVALALCGDEVAHAVTGERFIVNMFPQPSDEVGISQAKKLCALCPVREACLDKAISNGEQHGIWGGLTPEERTSLRRKKSRADAVLRKLIQDQVSIDPGTAKKIRGIPVENVRVPDDAPPAVIAQIGGLL